MLTRLLRIAAARDALNDASAEYLIAIADQLLNQGMYSYSLGRLGTHPNPRASSLWEVKPLFTSALKELGLPPPSVESALRAILRSHVEEIVEGARTPAEGIKRLSTECYAHLFGQNEWSRSVFEPCGCRPLMHLCDDYKLLVAEARLGYLGGPDEQARRFAAFEATVLETGTRWLRQYGQPDVDRRYLDVGGGAARQLAQTIRETRAFEALPVLADALEEAGCAEPEVLEHLRYPPGHLRCCWLVEWLLDVQ
jgi:hypothetical protein